MSRAIIASRGTNQFKYAFKNLRDTVVLMSIAREFHNEMPATEKERSQNVNLDLGKMRLLLRQPKLLELQDISCVGALVLVYKIQYRMRRGARRCLTFCTELYCF